VASSDSPHFNLWRFLNRIDLQIHITVTMGVGVLPQRASVSAHLVLVRISHIQPSLRSINIDLTTVRSTQRPSFPLSDPHIRRTTIIMAPPRVPRRWPTGMSNWTKKICASVLKKTTLNIDAVSSRSAFTEGLAAVQGWKTKYHKSTIPWYNNIKLYTKV
jgi:hypothetical protein